MTFKVSDNQYNRPHPSDSWVFLSSTEPECELPPWPESPYLKLIQQQNEDRQQMESANRWKLLDSQTPAHDVGALRRKVRHMTNKKSELVLMRRAST